MKAIVLLLTVAFMVAVRVGHVHGQCRTGFQCDDGECTTFSSDECDGFTDCDDGSDEEGCVNIGLAVGLSVFFFILFCVICPIIVCVLIWCCVAGALGQAFRNDRTVTTVHTTPAAATVVTPVIATTTTTAHQGVKADYPPAYPGIGGYPMQQYPPQQPSYPPQQPGYPPQQDLSAYPPQQPAYPPQQDLSAYPPQQPGYPPQEPPAQPAYPPQ